MGPMNQLKSMFHPSRAAASIIYILAILGTLYTALHVRTPTTLAVLNLT